MTAAAPPLGQVLETALYVDDLARAGAFYRDVLGLRPLAADGRFHAFAAGGRNVLLLFVRDGATQTARLPGGTIPPHGFVAGGPANDAPVRASISQHVAFAVAREHLPAWEARLAAAGVAIEGRTDWPKGGRSIYFRDPDGHLLELATPGLWDLPDG
ncbi:VOC family protein [Camelimonas abortus]|uniref:VOC family protein n=1 Tax=Camelimonas abortus TaxID=1017184 RepID=A0ABV7LGI9_9HYPH